jgi:hypothetical protein
VPKCRTTSGKVNPVFLKVKSVCARDLIGRQNAGLATC